MCRVGRWMTRVRGLVHGMSQTDGFRWQDDDRGRGGHHHGPGRGPHTDQTEQRADGARAADTLSGAVAAFCSGQRHTERQQHHAMDAHLRDTGTKVTTESYLRNTETEQVAWACLGNTETEQVTWGVSRECTDRTGERGRV